MATLTPPDFQYSARLYAVIRAALRQRGRVNVPELTLEDDRDPYMQLEQALAIIGHMNTGWMDWIARHFVLPTSLYRPAVVALLRLIDEQLAAATPAVVDIIARVTATFAIANDNLIPALSRFGTVAGADEPAISFESATTAIGTVRNDTLVSYAYDSSAGTYAVPTLGADLWPTVAQAGDLLYVGHEDLMFDALSVALSLAQANITAVWEYYGETEENPTGVSWTAPDLTFDLTSLLGTVERSGASVTIRNNETGQSETFTSTFGGGVNQVVTTELFGQSTPPSALAVDYLCSVEWTEISDADGGNVDLDSTTEDDVDWTLPQTQSEDWESTTINGLAAYWVRWRVISVAGPTEPQLSAAIGPGEADWYVKIPCTQGRTVSDSLGVSDGSASQAFELNNQDFVEGTLTALTVGTDTTWVVTDQATDLYSALPAEKIALVELLPEGTYQVLFGDGTNGAIPTAADAISGSYRVGAADDGNVGAETITRNITGVGNITDATNPRAATGWEAAEGSTDESLERVKRTKPAAFRTQGKAINADDCEALVVDDFTTAAGASPIARAWCIEEAYGIKTLGLFLVGNGGGTVNTATLTEIDLWFNGADPNDPERRLIANMELISANYVELEVDGAVTVTVRTTDAGVEDEVQAILAKALRPLDTFADGTYRWEPGRYGGKVKLNQIEGVIYQELSVRRAVEVEVTDLNGGGATDIALGSNELPTFGTWVVTVTVI